jgi:ABC-type transport system substrate-binding protein
VIPFFVSKAFMTGTVNPIAATGYGAVYNKVIALGNHSDTNVDTLIYAAQADTNPKTAKAKWQAATKYIQEQGYAIPSVHGGFKVFVNNKSKLHGIGTLKMPGGQMADVVETKGFEWTGIWKG